MINLFVGAVIDHYHEVKDRTEGNPMLTEAQRQWVHTRRKMMSARVGIRQALKINVAKLPKPRRICFRIVENKYFEAFIYVVIGLNTLLLASKVRGMSEESKTVSRNVGTLFTYIYIVEAGLKLTAYSLKYFTDQWNCFDFCLVLISLPTLVVTDDIGFATLFRVFRVARVIRLVRFAKGLQRLIAGLVCVCARAWGGGLAATHKTLSLRQSLRQKKSFNRFIVIVRSVSYYVRSYI